MVKKRKSSRRKTSSRKAAPKRRSQHKVSREKEPSYMVRVGEPKAIRKDILESLREVILVMQAYEQFRRIQDEKVKVFAQLKADVKELNNLIDTKLRYYLPKGKLDLALKRQKEAEMEEQKMRAKKAPAPRSFALPEAKSVAPPKNAGKGELDALESQLRDIEAQLQNIG